ncbi:hypothetical protein [Spartinivicinus ruber]|uniref:hypothetical protein n=1 Tax=Spartinivicinus ruber TaxID=2683272 RepID=UPI0013D069BB|nr:hypothetical protein [Spartinivicinus ruber]
MNTVATQKTNNIQKRVLFIMSSENKIGISGKLTGQSPASASPLADALIERLK